LGLTLAALLSRLRSAGLRARLLGVVLLAVVPLAGLLFWYAAAQNGVAQERARSEVQAKLESDVGSIQDLVAESRATLVTFGITYAIQAKQVPLMQGNIDRLKAVHPEYVVIAVAAPDGRIVASSAKAPATTNIAHTAFFERAVSAGSLVVSGYYVDPIVGRPLVAVSYPAYDPAGKLLYVEYVAFDTEALRARLSAAESTFFVEDMIDASGTVVARRPIVPGLEGTTRPDAPLNRAMLDRGTGGGVAAGLDGITREYYFAPIFPNGEGDLRLAVGFSVDEYLAAQKTSFSLTISAFTGVSLIALLAAWLVGTYSVYRPMRRLGGAAARLAEGDLSARSGVSTGAGEIDELAVRFDAMAEAIEHQVGELEEARAVQRALNEELEERVRRRTAELQASNTELEAFNYSVSHDLRAPLRAIDGFSQALLEDQADRLDDAGRQDLTRVKAAANRMGELIDSLLALSRLTRVAMDVREIDLSQMARDVAAELREHDPDREVEISIKPGVEAAADPTLIRSVLENLLGNAWKFTAGTAKGLIEFGSEVVEGETVFFVKDNGAGFDMAYSDKLFGAFQRLHDQSEFPGTGVGLATVARVIHRHGGRVWADGKPREGATFYFTLR
jgi:signal transduction histidine kinase